MSSSVLLLVIIFASLAVLMGLFYLLTHHKVGISPYGGTLLRGTVLSSAAAQKVNEYLSQYDSVDNPQIDFSKAVVCKSTGRVFPKAFKFWSRLRVRKNFLHQRYKGILIPWKRLSQDDKEKFIDYYNHLKVYMDDNENLYSNALYVDQDNNAIVEWKGVPGTILEVMVVQKLQNRNES